MPKMNLFVILSLKHTGGDTIVWWGPSCRGYVDSLEHAGRYTPGEIEKYDLDNRRSTVAVEEDLAKFVASRVPLANIHQLLGASEARLALAMIDLHKSGKAPPG